MLFSSILPDITRLFIDWENRTMEEVVFTEQFFKIFNIQNNGKVTLSDLTSVLTILHLGSREEKLRKTFPFFCLQGNDFSRDDMSEISRALSIVASGHTTKKVGKAKFQSLVVFILFLFIYIHFPLSFHFFNLCY